VDEYSRNFLENESIPGVATELAYYKLLLPQITLDDIKNVSALLQKTPNFFISLTGPQAPVLPSASSLVAVADSVTALKDIKPWEEKQVSTTLLKKILTKGKIIKETKDPLLGTKTWTLGNGTTVTIKKTDFKNDEIQMGARRFGGSSNYGVADKYNAAYALGVVNAMGYGDFSPTDLQKAMAGKTASAGVSMSRTTDGYSGSSSVKDLETMLQLLYLKATSPRKDTTLFQAYVQKNKAQLAFLLADPQAAFVDTLIKTVYHNDPASPIAIPRPEYFDKINLNRAMEIYRERFGNAYGMHFVFVGSIDEARLRPLVEKYIGGLPSVKKNFTFKDNGLRPVKGRIDLNVYKGQAEKSLILMMMTGETPYSEELALKAAAIAEVLNIRMNEELREKIQGIYSGHASVSLEKYPYPNYSVFVELPTGPEKIDTLVKAMNAEFRQIKTMGPSAENLSKVKIQWTESRRTAMKQNGTWMGYLLSASIDKRNPDRFLHYEKYVNALTPAEVQAAAKLLLSEKNIVNAILRPEKK
jgi:zinc protease